MPLSIYGSTGGATSLWGLFKLGGIWMWILLATSILALTFILERIFYFHKVKLVSKDFFLQFEQLIRESDYTKLKKFFQNYDCMISKIINSSFDKSLSEAEFEKSVERLTSVEVNELGRGLNILATIGSIAPLIGFLGTVAGMIKAFGSIAAADEVSARLVAGGIYTALLTTAFGLLIAIPAIAMYNFFVHKIDNFVADVEKIVNLLLNKKGLFKK